MRRVVSTERVYCIFGECDAIVIFYDDDTEEIQGDDTREIHCPKKHNGCEKYDDYNCPFKNG